MFKGCSWGLMSTSLMRSCVLYDDFRLYDQLSRCLVQCVLDMVQHIGRDNNNNQQNRREGPT